MSTLLHSARPSRRRHCGAIAGLFVALVFGLAAHADTADHDDAFLDLTFEEAQAKARAENKMVMIDFFTTWCAPCRRMDETTFRDPKVNAWLRAKTVPIRVDADQNAALKGRYKVNQYPTFVFTNPVGHQRVRLVGFRDAPTFLKDARAAMTGAGELGRARTRFLAAQDDPARRLTYAGALVRAEQYREALEHYLWCLDHQRGARQGLQDNARNAVLNDLAHLGERFPPAHKELIRRSDALAAAIALGEETVPLAEQVRTFIALNDVGLAEPDRSLALYDRLVTAKKGPTKARAALGDALRGTLMGAKRYGDVARDLGGDPGARLDEHIAAYDKQVLAAEGLPAALRKQSAGAQRKPVIQFGFMVYEVLLGTGQHQDAARVATRLLEFDTRPEARKVLLSIAKRLGDKKAAATLAMRG